MMADMAECPLVSIIIPAYNVAAQLSWCMDSVLAQTYPHIEVILVDDGSTDDTGRLCDAYAQAHPSVQAIHQPNAGQAAARNRALQLAKGAWICYVDSDDAIHPQMVALLMEAAKTHHVPIAACGRQRVAALPEAFPDIAGATFRRVSVDEVSLMKKEYDSWCVWARLIDRKIVEKHPFTEGRIFEDNAIVLYWLFEAGQIAFTDAPLYYYYINPTGTTGRPFSEKRLDLLWAMLKRADAFAAHGCRVLVRETLISTIYNTRQFCGQVRRELSNPQLARRIKRQTLSAVICRLKYADAPMKVLLRVLKLLLSH